MHIQLYNMHIQYTRYFQTYCIVIGNLPINLSNFFYFFIKFLLFNRSGGYPSDNLLLED